MTDIFKGQVIALSGTFPGYKQADIKGLIEANGGVYSAKVTNSCTHLLTTQKEADGNGTKNKQAANFKHIKVVSIDWLLDSIAAKKRSNEIPYVFGSSNAVPLTDGVSGQSKSAKDKKSNGKRALDSTSDNDGMKTENDGEPLPKKQKDGQKASSKSLKIPVDDHCPYAFTHQVYIDEDGLIFDAALNQTNAGRNNNKFYLIQLLAPLSGDDSEYVTWTRWGRVGEHGQNAQFSGLNLAGAMKAFERKFKDKSGHAWKDRLNPPKNGKYTFIERNYEDDDEEEDEKTEKVKKEEGGEAENEIKPVESKLPMAVQQLVGLIFNQQYFAQTMASMSYDANKLPLGKLSKRTLQAGFQALKDLAEVVNTPNLAMQKYNAPFGTVVEQLSNQFFTTIPHAFGRSRPPVIATQDLIKREVDLLETLTDMGIANEILKDAKAAEDGMHPLDRQFAGLNLEEMTPLDKTTTEFTELQDYLMKSYGSTHHLRYKVQSIFRIERQGEAERFKASPYANIKNSNRRLLWHGSRTTNYGGILSQGLRIAPPEAPVSGYMFGKGVYFADISSKSANYCWSHSSNNIGILLLCDVELGDPMLELKDADYNAGDVAKKAGKLATLGKGQTIPQGWKDAGCVNKDLEGVLMPDVSSPPARSSDDAYLMYNEYIVYDVAQIRQKYLLCVHMS